jgi:hypothetical protein
LVWNNASNTVHLIRGLGYTPVGQELDMPPAGVEKPLHSDVAIFLDGGRIRIKTCVINGSNYLLLSDFAKEFDFQVSWNRVDNSLTITTN